MTMTEDNKVEGTVEGTDIPIVAWNPNGGPARFAGDSVVRYNSLRDLHPMAIRSTEGPKGFWVVNDGAMMREIYQRPDIFSNAGGAWFDPEPAAYKWIPEHLDPPLHTKWRQLLSPYFSPQRVNAMEEPLRKRARDLAETLKDRGSCDYVADFSAVFPTTVFLDLFGVPTSELRQFMTWEDQILHSPLTEEGYGISMKAMNDVTEMFRVLIGEKRKSPGDDILSHALDWEIEGRTVTDEELLSFSLLMYMAGLDTMTAELAYSTYHLAKNPHDRQRLLDDPTLWPGAIEEFLRFYPIVTPGRLVMADVEINGCPFKKGDAVSLPIPNCNRDPKEFADADSVIIDRKVNNHIGFGAGPHRCLGSHLARREMKLGLEEWHKVIPHYRIPEGATVPEHVGMQIGIASLPLEW